MHPEASVADALGVNEITALPALKSLADEGMPRRLRGRSGGTFVAEHPAPDRVDAVTAYRADRRLVAALRKHDPIEAVAIIEKHVLDLHQTMFVGLGP